MPASVHTGFEPAPDGVRTILLVEDEIFVRDVVGEILCSAGYRVLKARTAAEALGVLHRLRERIELRRSPIVVLPDRNRMRPGRRVCAALPRPQNDLYLRLPGKCRDPQGVPAKRVVVPAQTLLRRNADTEISEALKISETGRSRLNRPCGADTLVRRL